MSMSDQVNIKFNQLSDAWNRGLKKFIEKGGTAKDFIKRFGNGPLLTPKQQIKNLLALSRVRTPAPQRGRQLARPSLPPSLSPAESKAIPRARQLSPRRMEQITLESRARCAQIVRYGMERNCLNQACVLAFETEIPASQAVTILKTASAVASMNGGKRHY